MRAEYWQLGWFSSIVIGIVVYAIARYVDYKREKRRLRERGDIWSQL